MTSPEIRDPRTWDEDEDVRTLLLEGSDDEVDAFLQVVREPADLAECLLLIKDVARRRHVFERLRVDIASEVLTELEEEDREDLLELMPVAEIARLGAIMDTDDVVDVIGELPPERRSQVIDNLPDEDVEDVKRLLEYPEDSAGGLMQLELVAVEQDRTVGEAISEIREQFEEVGEINVVWVVDSERRPVGELPLVMLVVHADGQPVSEVMDPNVHVVGALEDQEDVARLFQKYDLVATPVVDNDGRLVGRITVDDIVDVIEEEAEEDILLGVGAGESDLVYSGNILKISGARLAWLVANLVGGLLAAWLISMFTATLAEAIALAAFIPVITAMGGNVGIQSSTITIRGLATGRLRRQDFRSTLLKELAIGAVMGLVCGLSVAVVAFIWKGNPFLGMVVGLSLFAAMSVAAVAGALMPVVFRGLGFDPAIAASPFVTTANDISGIIIYFAIATSLLEYLK